MRTIEQIKNEVAQRHGYADWYDTYSEPIGFEEREKLTNEAILEYAKQSKEAQRESDSISCVYNIDRNRILNNPLVTDKIK